MNWHEMTDGLRVLEQLERNYDGVQASAEYGCAKAAVRDGYEYNTYNGMYIGRAVVLDLEVGGWSNREGGGSFAGVLATTKSILLLQPLDELRQPRGTGDEGGRQ